MALLAPFSCAELAFLVDVLSDASELPTPVLWQRGYCVLHGNRRRCNMAGCDRGPQTGGYCIRHGGGRRCQHGDCNRAAQTMGLCKAHGGGTRCAFVGCTKSSQSGGYCRRHGGGKQCAVQGCTRGVQKRQHCFLHRNCVVESSGSTRSKQRNTKCALT
ncbi:hypothetical protein SPRG_01704 [Saprolegnia parasitica CBS 223.65]|uniref:WRKY19-like zinc finger domain-containing protein n=1 Tax=Saprolegnia parasitica (strain CBS 223.65) TaxID=695850 RepID=A0A067CX50_SAPPC|nr:hypothetical protein SPRG_01704 [Saprolegnia parasitica CBS 223.65]KDO33825.1 hypothetical protein SPRG_01704 [Saprolegnia parasitica CBS 223.65]|eukprot:XP_012195461.1 hypothetical protein SPRG_01704 [Saprolegnia parasitica CBS 223.65]